MSADWPDDIVAGGPDIPAVGSGVAFGSLIPVVADGISDVTETATANMISDSFHVCQSIDFRAQLDEEGRARSASTRSTRTR